MHFPSCCSLQPPSLTPVPLPQFAVGFSPFPSLLGMKGWIQHWELPRPGQASQTCCGGLAVTPSSHTCGDGDPSSCLPNPSPGLRDGSNSTCFSHCLYLHFIYPLSSVHNPQMPPRICLAPKCCPQPFQPLRVPSHPHPRQEICHLPLK